MTLIELTLVESRVRDIEHVGDETDRCQRTIRARRLRAHDAGTGPLGVHDQRPQGVGTRDGSLAHDPVIDQTAIRP